MAAAMAGLRHIIAGYGYDITSTDVLDAYSALTQAAAVAGVEEATVKADVRTLIADSGAGGQFVRQILARHVAA